MFCVVVYNLFPILEFSKVFIFTFPDTVPSTSSKRKASLLKGLAEFENQINICNVMVTNSSESFEEER